MKTTKKTNKKLWILGLVLLAAVGCSDKDTVVTPEPEPEVPTEEETPTEETGTYLVATVFNGVTYLLTAEDLEDATVSITPTGNNGLEYSNTFTHYVNNGTVGLLGLKYGQGGTHVGMGFSIANGRAVTVGTEFEIPAGFTTAGSVGELVITARSAQTLTDGSTGAVFNFIDMANNNSLESRTINTGAFPDLDGRQVSFIGITDAGNNQFFTGLDVTNGSVDSVYVAKLDLNLNVLQVYTDDRLSRSGGQYRSARYSQIGNDEDGNTYVFSGAYSAETTKKAGALVIRPGATDFDASYYFDIEAKSSGYRFRKVWHIEDDYFLLEFYNDIATGGVATQFAVVKMSTQDFKWVSGLPSKEEIPDLGMKWPFSRNGKMYLGVTTAVGSPAIWVLDPATATATKGITVADVESIEGLGFIAD